jgi:hypothetical protein
LQADQREGRFTGDLPRSGQFVVERIKRQQSVPAVGRGEESGQEAVGVVAPNQGGYCFVHAFVVARLGG